MTKFCDGEIVLIPAWWNNDEPVLCEVGTVSETGMIVKPKEGNPHSRWVSFSYLKKQAEKVGEK